MTQYVAFLRGINVGGRIIAMKDLKTCFEAMRFENIHTVLQTGNVVFGTDESDSAQIRSRIESEISKQFDYDAHILLYSMDTVQKIVKDCPFEHENPDNHCYIVLLDEEVIRELIEAGGQLDLAHEKIAKGAGCIYWVVPKGMTLQSEFSKLLNKTRYKSHNTVRNINTMHKIIALAS